jgi:cyanophycinase
VPNYAAPGLLVLNGGDEFHPGNEPQDRELVAAAAGRGPAYVLPTAAARQGPDLAVANAARWFGELGLQLQELPVLRRQDAQSVELAKLARGAGLFYLVGGDPGLVVRTLSASRVWEAIAAAWAGGAALAGSSAGAMALCSHTLVMARWPRHEARRAVPALGIVPGAAVVPHYERFGSRWTMEGEPGLVVLGIGERTAAIWGRSGWRAAGAGAVTVLRNGGARVFPAGATCEGIPEPVVPVGQ